MFDAALGAEAVRPVLEHRSVRYVLSDDRERSAIATRRAGVRCSRGSLVAYLDDDDVWLPNKLECQLRRYAAERERVRFPVIAAVTINVDPQRALQGISRPLRHSPVRDRLGDSLFTRRSLTRPAPMIGSSSLLFERSLLEVVEPDPDIELHDDWLWLLRVEQHPDAHVSVVDRPLLRYRVNPPGRSVGTAGSGTTSYAVARRMDLSPRALGDFGLTVSAAMDVAQGDRRAGWRVARTVCRTARPGWPAKIWLGLMLVVPRRAVGPARRLVVTARGWLTPGSSVSG